MKIFQYILVFCVWVLFYALMLHEMLAYSIVLSVVESVAANLTLFGVLLLSSRAASYAQTTVSGFFWIIILAIVSALCTVLVQEFLLGNLLSETFGLPAFLQKSMLLHAGFALLASASAIGLRVQQLKMLEQTAIQKRKEDTERLAKEAELLKLRHQLQPHFLFNSLNSVNALIGGSPDLARKMVQQLSEFLRSTLRADDEKLVHLDSEIEHIELYLEIEMVRFGHRLKTHINVTDDARSGKLPPLLLQPIMENAIKFGLYGTTGDVSIFLDVTIEDNYMLISVKNPIDSDYKTQSGTGFGLTSIARRLNLIYGRNDLLSTDKSETEFTAMIRIPQQ